MTQNIWQLFTIAISPAQIPSHCQVAMEYSAMFRAGFTRDTVSQWAMSINQKPQDSVELSSSFSGCIYLPQREVTPGYYTNLAK